MTSRTKQLNEMIDRFILTIDCPTVFTTEEIMSLINYRWSSTRGIAYILRGKAQVTYLGTEGAKNWGCGRWLISPPVQ